MPEVKKDAWEVFEKKFRILSLRSQRGGSTVER